MTTRQLTRSTTDRRIAGVAGGMAAYFDVVRRFLDEAEGRVI
jgi:phage shock protein PspC (stress-responsive transcriptional regulator)